MAAGDPRGAPPHRPARCVAAGDRRVGAVAELMAAPGEYTEQAITGAAASRSSRPVMVRPVLVHPTGFRMSPYADIKPAGDDTATAARRAASAPPRKLWHSSPGSSGH